MASLKDGESPVKVRRCRATVMPLLVKPECPPVSLELLLSREKENQQALALYTD